MCGIAGILAFGDHRISEGIVIAMRDRLTHRGPDDAGLWLDDPHRIGLGHRRLSILDLSERGHQPMVDPQGRAVICYNGEVYNFAALRGELKSQGACFTSDTDTEVILQAYIAWGEGCLEKLEGMFAFAIWDIQKQQLFVARDRLGVKPLIYAQMDSGFYFGSEIRAVLAGGAVDKALDPEAAWDFFTYGYVPTPKTIYKSICKLPPAHCMTVRPDGTCEIRRWWTPQFESLDDDAATAREKLAELVDRSVADYLVADVPTGSYLSGGLDSSIVTQRAAGIFAEHSASRRLGGDHLNTFTIGFDVADHSETTYARLAAETYGTAHTELTVTREMAHEQQQTVLGLFDEPFAASSTIPMLFVAELARQQVTMSLCGEGGDEIFGGYTWYTRWREFRSRRFWGSAAGRSVASLAKIFRNGRGKKAWEYPALEEVELYAALMGAVAAEDKAAIFSPDLVGQMAGRDEAWYFRQHWRADLPPMARLQLVDLMTFLPDLNLTRADRTSMHVSLELRVPLLNHRLVEYAVGLGQQVRNPNGTLKGLFKQTFRPRLPEAIQQRKKKGFSAPVKQWFTQEDLARLIDEVVSASPDLTRDWLNPDIKKSLSRLQGSRGYKLWVFLHWLRDHN